MVKPPFAFGSSQKPAVSEPWLMTVKYVMESTTTTVGNRERADIRLHISAMADAKAPAMVLLAAAPVLAER